MANEIGNVQASTAFPAHNHGTKHNINVNRRGTSLVLPEFQEMVALGNVFTVNIGIDTTPNVFTETAYDQDQPQFGLDIPSGTTVIPLSCSVYLENMAGTDNEVVFRMDDGLLGAGTSTAHTIHSMLQGAADLQRASRCTARIQYTGNAAAITVGPEFIRWGNPFADEADSLPTPWSWVAGRDGVAPMAQGAARISGYVLGTSTDPEGFLNFTWAEFLTDEV